MEKARLERKEDLDRKKLRVWSWLVLEARWTGQWKWFCLKLRADLTWLGRCSSGAFFSPVFLFHPMWVSTAGGGLQHGLGTAHPGLWDP